MIVLQYLADRIGGSAALNDIALRKPGASFKQQVLDRCLYAGPEPGQENAFQNGFASFNYDTHEIGPLFYTGRAAMMFMGVWQIGDAQTNAPRVSCPSGLLPVPSVPGGKGDVNDIVGCPRIIARFEHQQAPGGGNRVPEVLAQSFALLLDPLAG